MHNIILCESAPFPRAALGSIQQSRSTIYLHPGQVYGEASPSEVTTILGSCVAVCLWDPVLGLGGVNHFLLPHWAGEGVSTARFGNVAVQRLIERLLDLGSSKQNLLAKVFGGACVLEAFRGNSKQLGDENVSVALHILQGEGIPVLTQDVGGHHGRKLKFQTDDGVAWLKRL